MWLGRLDAACSPGHFVCAVSWSQGMKEAVVADVAKPSRLARQQPPPWCASKGSGISVGYAGNRWGSGACPIRLPAYCASATGRFAPRCLRCGDAGIEDGRDRVALGSSFALDLVPHCLRSLEHGRI